MASVTDLVTMAASNPSIQASLTTLTPVQLQAVASQLQTTATDAMPAISLAAKVASGGKPSEGDIVGALTATASMISPIAGAAMGALGAGVLGFEAALQGLFSALGLYGAPPPEYHYNGLLRVGIDSPPYGPADPLWIDVSTLSKFADITIRNKSFGPYPPLSGYVDNQMVNLFGKAFRQLLSKSAQYKEMGGVGLTPAEVEQLYTAPSDFEKYFYTLFLHDMQLWANAQPYIPPKKLLAAATTLWNGSHADTSTVTFQPTNLSAKGIGGIDTRTPLISDILSPLGDPSGQMERDPPLTIHTGPVSSAATSAGTQVQAQKKITLHLPHGAPPAVGSAGPGLLTNAPLPVVVLPTSRLSKWLPFAPLVLGTVLFPVGGLLAPIAGGAVSALWMELRKHPL